MLISNESCKSPFRLKASDRILIISHENAAYLAHANSGIDFKLHYFKESLNWQNKLIVTLA